MPTICDRSFEPLHPWVSDIGVKYAHRAFANVDEDHPDLRRFMNDVSAWDDATDSGRSIDANDACCSRQEAKFISRNGLVRTYMQWEKFLMELPRLHAASLRSPPLVKDIRTNLMLGWLSRNCDCRTVMVVRHPGSRHSSPRCAVTGVQAPCSNGIGATLSCMN